MQVSQRTVTLAAADAYGFYDPKLAFTRLRRELDGGDDLKLGEIVDYVREGGRAMYRVTEANSIYVGLDGNHPLAGQDLVFEVEGTETRAAMPEDFLESIGSTASLLH
jgi:FKBP-type peptidyl-prolyl cis-trans isomerase SlyD